MKTLIQKLQATKASKYGTKKRKQPITDNRGWILRGYEKTVRNNRIVRVPRWESPVAHIKRLERQRQKFTSQKSQWQEFAIMLINILDQYEDTTDLRDYFRSLPR